MVKLRGRPKLTTSALTVDFCGCFTDSSGSKVANTCHSKLVTTIMMMTRRYAVAFICSNVFAYAVFGLFKSHLLD